MFIKLKLREDPSIFWAIAGSGLTLIAFISIRILQIEGLLSTFTILGYTLAVVFFVISMLLIPLKVSLNTKAVRNRKKKKRIKEYLKRLKNNYPNAFEVLLGEWKTRGKDVGWKESDFEPGFYCSTSYAVRLRQIKSLRITKISRSGRRILRRSVVKLLLERYPRIKYTYKELP